MAFFTRLEVGVVGVVPGVVGVPGVVVVPVTVDPVPVVVVSSVPQEDKTIAAVSKTPRSNQTVFLTIFPPYYCLIYFYKIVSMPSLANIRPPLLVIIRWFLL
jgi:hypothetical protein